jgi:predicted aconitase
MTNKKISELNAASTLAGTEVLPVVQSSATVKATVNQVLANLSATNLTSGTVPLARLSGITAEIKQSAQAHRPSRDADRQCDHH